MEGPLTKWTNLVNGWQYRWFVLDVNAGLLSYYTSLEKERKGDRRGCVKLKGAQVGIDDTEDCTFTITVDNKTFHFQARDSEERQKWLDALQEARDFHTKHLEITNSDEILTEFDKKIVETDSYLQLLINQEEHLRQTMAGDKLEEENILIGIKNLIEVIKQSIVCLQIAKQNSLTPLANIPVFDGINSIEETIKYDKMIPNGFDAINLCNLTNDSDKDNEKSHECIRSRENMLDISSTLVPDVSYSSSEDEFFDTQENLTSQPKSAPENTSNNDNVKEKAKRNPCPVDEKLIISNIAKDGHYDELYDTDEDELGSLQSHGSVITYLLSQLKIGMDLTKITLPTFILEKRSTLEMYADFLAHANLWAEIPSYQTPKERFLACLKWYLSAFHAGRKSSVAKKPYNPILGEIFRCYWDISSTGTNCGSSNVYKIETDIPGENANNDTQSGNFAWAPNHSVVFIAEQVSHHPPISAFYAEHKGNKIHINGHLWTKSKFLGLSIGVEMIGDATISLLEWNEEYIVTFPSGYGRNILSVPWIELGGKCSITCAKTGYYATVEFKTKPFYGGKKDQVRVECFSPNEKKSFMTVDGEWNDKMFAKFANENKSELFIDVNSIPILRKMVRPRTQQLEYESRRLWQDVTKNLKTHNIEAATSAKSRLEQKQRDEAKYLKENHIAWELRNFDKVAENYTFKYSLNRRTNRHCD